MVLVNSVKNRDKSQIGFLKRQEHKVPELNGVHSFAIKFTSTKHEPQKVSHPPGSIVASSFLATIVGIPWFSQVLLTSSHLAECRY